MVLAVRPSDTASVSADVRLAVQYPDVAQWALGSYRQVAAELPTIWPPTPDERRVRYYVWAARQARDCHEALTLAWDLLHAVGVFMGGVADDLDTFERTGGLPTLSDEDLEPRFGPNPLIASLRQVAGAIASTPAAPAQPALTTRPPQLATPAKPARRLSMSPSAIRQRKSRASRAPRRTNRDA
jgi:hypothetical protein